jgi:hypothetical protein
MYMVMVTCVKGLVCWMGSGSIYALIIGVGANRPTKVYSVR